jgi:hypothetical protein
MRIVAACLVVLLAPCLPAAAAAQAQGDIWRAFVEKVEVGTELTVRLNNGQRFRATLVGAQADAVLLQPKTRVPVAVQPVPYDAIVSLEERPQGGTSAAKAAAIGVATGVVAFFGMLLILLAGFD